MTERSSTPAVDRGWAGLLAILVALFALRVWFGVASVPTQAAGFLNLVSAVAFVVLPIVALFFGASLKLRPVWAGLTLALGVGMQVGAGVAVRQLKLTGLNGVLVESVGQTGLLIWCLGLGVLVAQLIKEKNLILPVAFFLAGFDAFLVLTPYAPTAKIVEQNPAVFQSVASAVPKAREAKPAEKPKEAKLEPLAFIGPADFLFAAVFFALLFRFQMRVRETALWLAPVLVLYLLVVLSPFGLGMLPALVPIGGTVLLVNRKEFTLTKDEIQATWAVAVIALALAGFGLYQRINHKPTRRPAAPANGPANLVPAAPAKTPSPAPQG